MDTPTAVRLSHQAHALGLLQERLQVLQAENLKLQAQLQALQALLDAARGPANHTYADGA